MFFFEIINKLMEIRFYVTIHKVLKDCWGVALGYTWLHDATPLQLSRNKDVFNPIFLHPGEI